MIISIRTTRNTILKIDAVAKNGSFAIHYSLPATDAPGFVLTHINTGSVVRSGLCCAESAEALADALAEFDWDFGFTGEASIGKAKVPFTRDQKIKINAIFDGWECPKGCGA